MVAIVIAIVVVMMAEFFRGILVAPVVSGLILGASTIPVFNSTELAQIKNTGNKK